MTEVTDVRIVQLDPATLQALADGDLDRARETRPAPLTPWLASEECRGTWAMRARQVVESPEDADWVTGVVVDGSGTPVGRAGFHAAPDPTGTVEVGYAVDPAHRRQGHGRAVLRAMVERAREDVRVRRVLASVSPTNDASLAMITEHGFAEIGEQWDDEDGLELVFELDVD